MCAASTPAGASPSKKNGETLRAQLLSHACPFILRRLKRDVATELPPRTETSCACSCRAGSAELYEAVRTTADKQVRAHWSARALKAANRHPDALLLRQVCCDPRFVKPPKTAHTMERASSNCWPTCCPALVDEGRRVLVFAQFTEMLALTAELVDTWPCPTSPSPARTPRERGAVVKRFQAQDETSAPILLASLKAGGVGLNLTAPPTP